MVGWLIDRIGSRKIVLVGMVMTGASLVLMSRINSLMSFYSTFAIMAIGTSCGLGLGPYVAVANWFSRKRTWAMAVMSAGYAFSGAMGPVLVRLIGNYGWRKTLVISGIAMWVIGVPLSLVMRHRPEQYGCLPDGAKSTPAPGTSETLRATGPDYTPRQALMTGTFWTLIAFGILTGFAQSAIIVHEMPYLTDVGISRNLAGWVILGITGVSLFGRLGFGWMGDRYDKRWLLAGGAVLQCLGVLVFAGIGAPWTLVPFILLYGPGYASQVPLWPAIRADYFGMKHYGAIGGLQSLASTICGISAPVLAGWVFDISGTYRLIWLAFAAATALAIPFALLARPPGRARLNRQAGSI
jgi:MFS family permease